MGITHEKIVDLIGVADDVNLVFTTPSFYVLGTLRVLVNGVAYVSSHSYYGWTEVSDTEIQMATPPEAGSRMQAFYQEAEPQGSPFHPTET